MIDVRGRCSMLMVTLTDFIKLKFEFLGSLKSVCGIEGHKKRVDTKTGDVSRQRVR